MALQGTLDTFALPDVLRLLATTAKTGRLHVEGDRGQGSVWLRDGTVMAAGAERAPDDATAEEVVFELLRFEDGSFAFQMDELSPNGEQPEDVEILLRNAGALLKEWNELKGVVPSLDHRVTLVDSLPADQVTIDADRWPLLVTVARSGRSIGDLARSMGLSELSVVRTIRDLVDLGVVSIEAPRETPRPSVDRTRSDRPSRDRSRTSPFGSLGSGETLATAPPGNGGYTTGEMQRDGWLQSPERTSGSHTAVTTDPRASALPPADTDLRTPPSASPAADATMPMSRLPSRETPSAGRRPRRQSGRSGSPSEGQGLTGGTARSASTGGRRGAPGSGGDRGQSSGSHPAVREGLGPSASTSRSQASGNGDAGSRRSAAPSRPSSRESRLPRRTEAPAPAPDTTPPSGGGSGFDRGLFAPSSPPTTSGLFPAVPPSSGLAPDLPWAQGGETPTTPPNSPFGAAPGGSFADPGKVAPHVAAMSDEARAAVQQTLGNGGGLSGPPGAGAGEDLAHRGQLINFLSSVRP